MSYQQLLSVLSDKFSVDTIKENDLPFIQTHINKKVVINVLKDILDNPSLLIKIANRSYTHALGFDKIVLMDFAKDFEQNYHKAQLRLHIWDPQKINAALPIVESLHEHSFDFISTILSGHLENQQFILNQLNTQETDLLNKVKTLIAHMNTADVSFFNEQLEIIEAIKLAELGSKQLESMQLLLNYNLQKLQNITQFSKEELFAITAIEGHYVSDRVTGERKAYKHILKEYLSIVPFKVLSLNQGDYYFHPYQLPHRLYYDNTILNSTVLLTTPVSNNPDGGSLQRPTYVQKEEQSYTKIPFSEESLKICLNNYMDYLVKN